MKNKTCLIVLAIFLTVGIVGLAGVIGLMGISFYYARPAQHTEPRDFEIRFGILGVNTSGDDYLNQETTTLPLLYKKSGFRYGLIITDPHQGDFTYQILFHFSAPPKIVSDFDSDIPSATMRSPVLSAQGNAIEEYWFDPGDPSGHESMDIYINGQLAKTINYTVVPVAGD